MKSLFFKIPVFQKKSADRPAVRDWVIMLLLFIVAFSVLVFCAWSFVRKEKEAPNAARATVTTFESLHGDDLRMFVKRFDEKAAALQGGE
jgi:hypothetical protein